MADAEQVYRAHPTSGETAEVLAKRLVAGRPSRIVQGRASTGRSLMMTAEGVTR